MREQQEHKSRAKHRPALVLGGGGTYGMVQAAYVQALCEQGFEPEIIVGTSVGSLNGSWVAMHPDQPEELLRIWRDLDRIRVVQLNPMRLAARVVRRPVSLCTNEIVPRLIEQYVGATHFEETKLPLAVVATNLTQAKKHVFSSGPIGPAVLASTAIPGVFEPVELDGELYVDGGVSGGCDLATAFEWGATEIVAIDLTPPPPQRRPRTAVGVLRQSLTVLERAATGAMEDCLREQLPVRVLTPDLSRHSPWRLDVTDEAVATNLALARKAVEDVVDADGRVVGGGRKPVAFEQTLVPARAPRQWPRLGRFLPRSRQAASFPAGQ